MLLKSSDFIVHDLSAESVFEGCVDEQDRRGEEGTSTSTSACESESGAGGGGGKAYGLELVLRKWFAIDPSREMRAFVRDGVLVGACVRCLPPVSVFCVLSSLTRTALCENETKTKTKRNRHVAARYELL